MPTIAELNVRIGSNIKGLEAGLRGAESALKKSGATLSGISAQLTNTFSLAFAGLGAGALKSFRDIEKLQKGLEAQLGSAEAAREEMAKIREEAKAPGLGFEQFVKGSLQLQAVGDSADKSRQTISAFGNALALAGKGAGELDGVVTALTQIKSKGVISAEEINQIAERLPQIRPAMQDAFGTASTEAIQKLGITATQFVDGIVASLEKLPKASSSFSNDLTNAFDNVKQGAARLGESINNSLRVGQRLTSLSEWVIGVADAFGNLDENTQRWVIGIGVAVAAIGPAIKAGNAMVQVGGAIGNAWTKMTIIAQQWVVAAANPEAKTGLINWWKGLNTVMKANIIGITIGVVLALGAAFLLLSKDMSAAAVAQRSVNEVNHKAAESIAGQKNEVESLVAAYKTEGASLTAKKNILNELKRISPEYFGTLKVGKGDVEALSAATAAYSAELLKVAKITAAKERLVEIEKAVLNLNKTAEPTTLQTFGNVISGYGNLAAFAANQTSSFTKNLNEQKGTLEAERDALVNLVTQQTLADAGMGKLNTSTKEATVSAKDLAKAKKEAAEIEAEEVRRGEAEIKMLNEIKQAWVEEAAAIEAAMAARAGQGPALDTSSPAPDGEQSVSLAPQPMATEGITAGTNALYAYSEAALYAAEVQQQLNDKTFSFSTGLTEVSAQLLEQGNLMGAVFVAMGDAIGKTAAEGELSFKALGLAAAGAAAKVVRAYIQEGVAAAVASALEGLPFPLNIAAGAIAGGIAAGLFTRAIGAIGVKGFAKGTNNAPGGIALVGEQGPELVNLPAHSQVIPSPRTSRMLNDLGGGNSSLSGEFTVRGTDLVLVLERAKRKNERFR